MKSKITILIILIISIFWINHYVSASCDIDPGIKIDLSSTLKWCLSDSPLVGSDNPKELDVSKVWFKEVILWWVKSLSMFLAVWAVFWIAYWSFLLTLSWWEDEKIKKWKDLVKWSIIWFTWVAFAWTLISIVINFIYSLSP